MEKEYDLDYLKTKYFVKNNYILVENNGKIFIFYIFFDKKTDKMEILFREIYGDKIDINNIRIIQNIIKDIEFFINDEDI